MFAGLALNVQKTFYNNISRNKNETKILTFLKWLYLADRPVLLSMWYRFQISTTDLIQPTFCER